MNPNPQGVHPDEILKAVREAAVLFKRDTCDHLPSGDEVQRLVDQGKQWRWLVCGYLRVPPDDTIFCMASSNELKPTDDWWEKAYEAVILQLANGLVRKLRENATKLVVPEASGQIVKAT